MDLKIQWQAGTFGKTQMLLILPLGYLAQTAVFRIEGFLLTVYYTDSLLNFLKQKIFN